MKTKFYFSEFKVRSRRTVVESTSAFCYRIKILSFPGQNESSTKLYHGSILTSIDDSNVIGLCGLEIVDVQKNGSNSSCTLFFS